MLFGVRLNGHIAKGLVATRLALFALATAAMVLGGCASLPERADVVADQAGFASLQLRGGPFSLQGYEREASGTHARVYIEGDGRPWRAGGRVVSNDPTPRRLLALDWMRKVPGPALYLGRPCYFASVVEHGCQSMLWTYGRYSETVVQSLAGGLESWLRTRPQIKSLTLVGHSGGGVLALLLAERVTLVEEVIAVSTPVDIDIWTQLHGYTPLFASLNPSQLQAWRGGVKRRIYFGEQDRQVPPDSFVQAARSIGSRVTVVEDKGHDCCGPDIWFVDQD